MVSGASTMTFLAFPREIRDLIYTHLTTQDKTYSITATNVTTRGKAASRNLGIVNSCKTIRYEMLEMLSPKNTFRFTFPYSDTNTEFSYNDFITLSTRMEFYIDFSSFSWRYFRLGRLDPAIRQIDEQVCEAILKWNAHPTMRESCRIIIGDKNQSVSPLLQLRIFEGLKTLSGLETLLIIVLKYKSNLRKLGALLQPSLGRSTIHYMWPPLPDVKEDYGCINFNPRILAAEEREKMDGKVML